MTYRNLSAQALAEQDYDGFLTELEKSLTDGRRDPNDVVRDTLFDLHFGGAQPDKENLSLAARAALHNFDPRNITTEPEHYSDIDANLYASAQADDLVVANVRSLATRAKRTSRTPSPPDTRAAHLSQRG